MDAKAIINLLLQNGYTYNAIFKFYHQPNKSIGSYFYISDTSIVTGKIKWGQITLKEIKTLTPAQFQASSFGLTTELDIKRQKETMKRMAINRAKAASMREKGFIEPDATEELTPQVTAPE